MNNTRVEIWQGYRIRFVEVDGVWYAVLKDICDALKLRTKDVSQRLHPDTMLRIPVEGNRNRPSRYGKENYEDGLNDVVNSSATFHMLGVNETGIYQALFASRRLEARKFQYWTGTVMTKLRKHVGLEGYEVMRMTEPDIQNQIDYILDALYVDPDTKQLMISVTVQGGDVDQIPYEEYVESRCNK